jgi:hypothetical protein
MVGIEVASHAGFDFGRTDGCRLDTADEGAAFPNGNEVLMLDVLMLRG